MDWRQRPQETAYPRPSYAGVWLLGGLILTTLALAALLSGAQ